MVADSPQREKQSGFEGSIAGLPLTDVIQLKGHNRFTGAISVEYRQRQGMIFFRDGEIIHAEQGGGVGEQALFELIRWPGGRFSIQPKVTTTSRTIHQGIGYLLLEAHRLIDEEKAGVGQEGGKATATRRMSPIAERLLQISGVAYAVVLRKDGTPVEDNSAEGKILADKGRELSLLGNRLGQLFGLGAVKSAAVSGKTEQQLLFEAKNHYISIAVRGESSLAQVEADIRSTFAARR